MVADLFRSAGWARFGHDDRVLDWVEAALPHATQALKDPAQKHQYQCEDTWFVGVDVLPNDARGRLPDGPALGGPALDLWRSMGHTVPPLHRAQVSVTWSGYPKPRAGEGEGAFRYRQIRDAAHVDGLLPVGPERARMVKEPHAFILGMALNAAGPNAAPLVVWEGSHHVVARHLSPLFASAPKERWSELDLTQAYHAARQECFAQCRRIEVALVPGESVLLHHLCLHGIAPWPVEAEVSAPCRMMAYFRPEWGEGVQEWAPVG